MKVKIEDKIFDFDPQFNPHKPSENGWKKQNTDSFKFIEFDKKKIFVKRMDKESQFISGYQFLVKIKNIKFNGLPKIYDLVSQIEGKNRVYYLFQEAISGDTMENIIENGVLTLNPQKFAIQIYGALKVISDNGFWFTDFIEKNIFIGNDGNYYLIDLDSVASINVLPNSDHHFIASINKNFKIAVSTYWYRDTFKYDWDYIRYNLKGNTINFLELFIYVGQLSYYIKNISRCDFFSSDTRKAIPNYLLGINKNLTTAVFKNCFDNSNNQQHILKEEVFRTYIKHQLFKENRSLKIDFIKKKIITNNFSLNTNLDLEEEEEKQQKIRKQKEEEEKEKKRIANQTVKTLISEAQRKYSEDNLIVAKNILKEVFHISPMNASARSLLIEIENKERENDENLLKLVKEKKRNDEITRIKNLQKTPYECNKCGFPVIEEEDTALSNIVLFISIVGSIFFLLSIGWYWFSLLGIIIGPFSWGIIRIFLPESWIKRELTCKNCDHNYYTAHKKIK